MWSTFAKNSLKYRNVKKKLKEQKQKKTQYFCVAKSATMPNWWCKVWARWKNNELKG